jgi:hypothetical protein
MTNLYLIVFLLIFIILCAFISTVLVKDNMRTKEGFASSSDALELKILKVCGRNLVFPYYGANNINTASQRALMDTSVMTSPAGKCAINDAVGVVDDSTAMVHENSIFYALKKACLGLSIVSYKFEKSVGAEPNKINTRLVIEFKTDTMINASNFAKFLLVNPLFVEFNFQIDEMPIASIAYIPNIYNDVSKPAALNSLEFNNYSYNQPSVQIAFDIAVGRNEGQCDKGFYYSKLSSKQQVITDNLMKSIFNKDKIVHLTVFYLGDLGLNFQRAGRTLPTTQATKLDDSSMMIFEEDFAKISSDPYRTAAAAFMQTFATFYNNFITPVLTFTFDVVVGTDKKTKLIGSPSQLLKAFMKNNYLGGREPCANNIVSVGLTGDSSKLRIQVGVGNKRDCGTVKGRGDWGNPALYLDLPYLTPNTAINLTLTIGQNQKHLYAEWYDINAGNKGKQFAYAKTVQNLAEPPYNICRLQRSMNSLMNKQIGANNFTRMFSSRTLPRPELKTTILEWDKAYVTKVRGVTLGYVNFNDINASQ